LSTKYQEAVAHQTSMKWTKEKPTIPGHYWIKDSLGLRVVIVREYRNQMCILNWPVPTDSEWAGPLSLPEESE